ncbi:MAG: hypothetical protein R3282_04290 [Rhodothermales bacterium]|nr:hypothetical protein [Rhodothermales bacterium]
MTHQLARLIERLHQLDLTEDDEQRIVENLSATLDQIHRSTTQRAEAAARMRERRKGHHLPNGLTIRDMIEDGRR